MSPLVDSKGGPDPILDAAWTSDSSFVTCGPKNYTVWKYENKKLSKGKGKLRTGGIDDKLVCCVFDTFTRKVLVGTLKGYLQVWTGKTCGKAN